MTTRHELLARLHHLLQPRFYFEVGVHTGESLKLASCEAWGVDPHPMMGTPGTYQTVWSMTSDSFFDPRLSHWDGEWPAPLDLAFIDGMHLYEFALRDFINIEQRAHGRTVVVFDDVMPYNNAIASRIQPPGGDWTGDVWKVWPILMRYRPDLNMALIDTSPTGTLVVWNLDPSNRELELAQYEIGSDWSPEMPVEASILDRSEAISSEDLVHRLLVSL